MTSLESGQHQAKASAAATATAAMAKPGTGRGTAWAQLVRFGAAKTATHRVIRIHIERVQMYVYKCVPYKRYISLQVCVCVCVEVLSLFVQA